MSRIKPNALEDVVGCLSIHPSLHSCHMSSAQLNACRNKSRRIVARSVLSVFTCWPYQGICKIAWGLTALPWAVQYGWLFDEPCIEKSFCPVKDIIKIYGASWTADHMTLERPVISRVHATLWPTLSVCLSVCPSVCLSVPLSFF